MQVCDAHIRKGSDWDKRSDWFRTLARNSFHRGRSLCEWVPHRGPLGRPQRQPESGTVPAKYSTISYLPQVNPQATRY